MKDIVDIIFNNKSNNINIINNNNKKEDKSNNINNISNKKDKSNNISIKEEKTRIINILNELKGPINDYGFLFNCLLSTSGYMMIII